MKTTAGLIVLGLGFLLGAGTPAYAQLGELGNAVKQGAEGAAKQELMKQAGLPTAGAAAATPGAETGGANAPTPAAAAPADAPGTDGGAPNVPSGD